jgi:uncharacterized protein YjbI with pentapeptide repeats
MSYVIYDLSANPLYTSDTATSFVGCVEEAISNSTDLSNLDGRGQRVAGITLTQPGTFTGASFEGSNSAFAIWNGDMSNTDFTGSEMLNSDLSQCDVTGINTTDADTTGVIWPS